MSESNRSLHFTASIIPTITPFQARYMVNSDGEGHPIAVVKFRLMRGSGEIAEFLTVFQRFIDLIACNRPKGSMISDERKGNRSL